MPTTPSDSALQEQSVTEVRVTNEALGRLVGLTKEAVRERRRPPFSVAFINPHSIEAAHRYVGVADALASVDFAAPDSVLLLLASRLTGPGLRYRYSGIDFLHRMLQFPELSHFFLGSTDRVLKRISVRLREHGNGHRVGYLAPPQWPWTDSINTHIIDRINEFSTDVLWVGLSAPKQELWMHSAAEQLDVSAVAAIGYAFDTFAETKPLAPQWIRTTGLEWLYRFAHEPTHTWRRVFVTAPRFTVRVCQGALRRYGA